MKIKEEYREETIIHKSRFIACVKQTRTEEEARNYIEYIRKEFPDASHVCTAYSLGPNQSIQRSSDNKEPAGTAGVPILESIRKNDVEDVTVCVVRYFGGIKLGTGGLVRAYGGSAADALAHAAKTIDVTAEEWQITYPYTFSGTLETWLRRNTQIVSTIYGNEVTMIVRTEEKNLLETVQNLTKGAVQPEFIQTVSIEKDL